MSPKEAHICPVLAGAFDGRDESATELSATDAWHGAAAGDKTQIRLIRTITRSTFRKNARN